MFIVHSIVLFLLTLIFHAAFILLLGIGMVNINDKENIGIASVCVVATASPLASLYSARFNLDHYWFNFPTVAYFLLLTAILQIKLPFFQNLSEHLNEYNYPIYLLYGVGIHLLIRFIVSLNIY